MAAPRTDRHPRRVLIAPDKFRGSLTAPEVAAAAARGARDAGWEPLELPLADGGEGMLDAFGGADRTSEVTGPHGRPVRAPWLLRDGVAVIESAAASGLDLAGGRRRNDPVAATSAGTGELIAEAVLAGAGRIVIGLGGSAMTDGGAGAVEAVLERLSGDRPVDRGVVLVGACDVRTTFTDAARVFGPQKGADPEQVELLTARLEAQLDGYRERFGVDLATVPGAGAAGGLGGGLVVLGAELVPGFDLVADQVGLADLVARADAVVTGEGALDAGSFQGKVVGGVLRAVTREASRARADVGIPVVVIAGTVRQDAPSDRLAGLHVVDLIRRHGPRDSWRRTAGCVRASVREALAALG